MRDQLWLKVLCNKENERGDKCFCLFSLDFARSSVL